MLPGLCGTRYPWQRIMQSESLSSNIVEPAASAAPADRRPGAVSDVVNLFAHFGAAGAAVAYQEIYSDVAADAAARRWPLVAEWLRVALPASGRVD